MTGASLIPNPAFSWIEGSDALQVETYTVHTVKDKVPVALPSVTGNSD